MTLFDNEIRNISVPLASRVRPKNLDQFVGQQHLIGQGKILRRMIETDQVTSMIFWVPPGVGKTTLAGIIAETTAKGTDLPFTNSKLLRNVRVKSFL